MDQVKIGRFIAQLRRERHLTQEALGEKLGVTNKTISRWENGNYMPDIEMLQLLGKEFSASINELLRGRGLLMKIFAKKRIRSWFRLKSSCFPLKDQMDIGRRNG